MGSGGNDHRLIVFSDLDGTLLDHNTYEWQAATPALARLTDRNIPLILVSSKTYAELKGYRDELQLDYPVVSENGAAIHVAGREFPESLAVDGAVSREELQRIYREIKAESGCRCEAFFELGTDGIVTQTALPKARAELANQRAASEPILWLDTDAHAAEFIDRAVERGLNCVRGGRFLHLIGQTSKEKAVQQLIDAYADRYPDDRVLSVSLGDGPNDIGMLETTDIAVVIPGKHRHDMTLTTQNRIVRPAAYGPAGWNEAMLALLAEL
ncbi:MAG: HAD-IIB family hydrolase [Pseudomonadota bacterium]